jgi:GNAT superfamily N-acetyltransferase
MERRLDSAAVASFDLDSIRIRRARPSDRDAILALVPRLVAFGPPAWRDPEAMSGTDCKVIDAALRSETLDPIVLVAVLEGNIVAGFLHLHSEIDYYRETKNGHVADLVVAEAYEGKGIARQLLSQAEDWARGQQFDWLTISVFRENARAARTYERLGFKEDRVRLLKPLR